MDHNVLLNLLIEEFNDDMIFEDDDDDEEFIFNAEDRPRKTAVQDFWEFTVENYSETEFKEAFRINRDSFNYLLERFVSHDIYTSLRGTAISADKHLGIFLWFAAHEACCFRDLRDRFNVAIGTVHNIIVRVTYFMSDLATDHIIWPDEGEKKITAEYFHARKGFPNVCGLIDGSHVKFDPPKDKSFDFYNRKKETTIQMQAVCNHNKQIIDFYVGWPGKVHDARVFKNSQLFFNLENLCGGKNLNIKRSLKKNFRAKQ